MLADSSINAQSGFIANTVHLPSTFLHALIEFISEQLPLWRDSPGRPTASAETALTSQLCSYLTSAARRSPGWDILQFRTEIPDEVNKGRAIDLAPAPCNVTLFVEGRKYIEYDILMPIECKRLPTPSGSSREETEYVYTKKTTTGGIQRFKNGLHGANHQIGAIIGYIQDENAEAWFDKVTEWIDEIIASKETGWSALDHLTKVTTATEINTYQSKHSRELSLSDIELRHLWIDVK